MRQERRKLLMNCVLWCVVLLVASKRGPAAELPPSRQYLPPETVAVIEVEKPVQVLDNPIWQRITTPLQRSGAVRDLMAAPQFDPLRDLVQYTADEFQQPILKVLQDVAGHSLVLGVGPNPQQQWGAVVTGDDPASVARIPDALLKFARRVQEARGQFVPDPQSREYQGAPVLNLGPFHYAVRGRHFCLASQPAILEGMLDRIEGRQALTASGICGPDSGAEHTAAVRLRVQGEWLRNLPGAEGVLKLPHPDPAAMLLLGGWIDLLRRSEHLTLEIDYAGETLVTFVRFSARATEAHTGLKPFFGTTPDAGAAPIVRTPHLLFSGSWYRDYARLWELRNETVNPDAVKTAEEQNAEVAKRNRGTGPLEALQTIGPHHRIFAARVLKSPYQVPVVDRLPTVGYLVDLRDEAAFRKRVMPQIQEVASIVSLIFKMVPGKQTYKEAEIISLRFAEDPATVAQGDRIRYNFEPAYAVYHGHVIFGSTIQIVRDAMDHLATQPEQIVPAQAGQTEQQLYQFAEFAGLVDDLRETSLREAALGQGLSVPDAEHELGVFQELLRSLGELHVTAGDTERGFEYRLELLPPSASSAPEGK